MVGNHAITRGLKPTLRRRAKSPLRLAPSLQPAAREWTVVEPNLAECRCTMIAHSVEREQSVVADKKSKRPLTIKPAGNPAVRWIAAFIDYARTECHLSVNTVAAYRRDLAKFAEWLAAREITKL